MSGLARVRVNGFDFDSHAPVQGEVFDAQKQAAWKIAYDKAVEYGLAINVVLLGWWLMDWWVTGGVRWMFHAFHTWGPTLMRMVTTGQL